MTPRRSIPVADYLEHVLQAAERAIQCLTGIPDRAAFESMWMHQEAVIRLITVIGEAATQLLKLHPAFVSSHPGVPWEKMSTMRNRVVHDYFEIDLDIVWNTVKQDLPALATQIRVLLQEPGVRGTTAG